MEIKNPKNLFIISGPSGAGEDSIINGLEKNFPVERVITTTTREMRPGDSEGHPYYFISREDFKKRIAENKFIEWAEEYNKNLYGVTHKEINRVIDSGRIGLWKIEYKGVMTAKKIWPEIVAIFINAPLEVLADRIRRRSHVSEEYIQERLQYTKEWLKHINIYDYTVENEEGKLNEAIAKTAEIITKHARIDRA